MTRRNTPRRKYAIEPAAAEVVKTIYRWYVTDRVKLSADRAAANDASSRCLSVPTAGAVRDLLTDLKGVLLTHTQSPRGEDATDVRTVIDLLTGGRIELEQVGERRSHGGYLRGRFRLRLVRTLTNKLLGVRERGSDEEGEEVVIDYRKSYKRIPPEKRDRVMAAFRDGKTLSRIAMENQTSRHAVRDIVAAWHAENGLPTPDLLGRRKTLLHKQALPSKAQRLSEEVHDAIARGETVDALTKRLGVSEPTVLGAWAYWFKVRELPVQTVRAWKKANVDPASGGLRKSTDVEMH